MQEHQSVYLYVLGGGSHVKAECGVSEGRGDGGTHLPERKAAEKAQVPGLPTGLTVCSPL